MALIHLENFTGPYLETGDYIRFGGHASSANTTRYAHVQPYTVSFRGDYERYDSVIDTTVKEFGCMQAPDWIKSFVESSRTLVCGIYLENFTGFEMRFSHVFDGSSYEYLNFKINVALNENKQRAEVSFEPGDETEYGYPDIPNQTMYYDFTQPMWIWVMCNMDDLYHGGYETGPRGICKIWANNTELISLEDIQTGDEVRWLQQWDMDSNNVIHFEPSGHPTVYKMVVLNEGYNYMNEPLGNVDLATLAPESGMYDFAPRFEGSSLQEDNAALIAENIFLDLSKVYEYKHVRGTDGGAREVYYHEHPFVEHLHNIKAVSQTTVHQRQSPDPEYVVPIKLEPTYILAGQPAGIDREAGQISLNQQARVIQRHHTIPYVYNPHGQFEPWSEDFLRNSQFGVRYYSPVHFITLNDSVSMLEIFEINIYIKQTDLSLGVEDWAFASPYLYNILDLEMQEDLGVGLSIDYDWVFGGGSKGKTKYHFTTDPYPQEDLGLASLAEVSSTPTHNQHEHLSKTELSVVEEVEYEYSFGGGVKGTIKSQTTASE